MPGRSDQSIYSSYLEDNAAGGGFGNSPVLVIHHLFLVKAGPRSSAQRSICHPSTDKYFRTVSQSIMSNTCHARTLDDIMSTAELDI